MTALRLLKAWKRWPVGHEFPAMPGNLARALIARGVGEEIGPPAPAASGLGKIFSSPVNRMIDAPVKRRK